MSEARIFVSFFKKNIVRLLAVDEKKLIDFYSKTLIHNDIKYFV